MLLFTYEQHGKYGGRKRLLMMKRCVEITKEQLQYSQRHKPFLKYEE